MFVKVTYFRNVLKTQGIKSAIVIIALFISSIHLASAQEAESTIPPATTATAENSVVLDSPIFPVEISPTTESSNTEVVPADTGEVQSDVLLATEQTELSKEQEKQLKDLDKQLEKGEISPEEYELQKQLILNSLDTLALRAGETFDPESQTFGKYLSPKVNTSDGALTYQYPIVVPPGRNGLTPNHTLTYNSNNKSYDSVFGAGWTIDIPYIQRVNKKGSEKLYTENYFVSSLDGELVSLGSGVYVPRVEDGKFIKYQYSNSVWTATDKDGTVYKFGTTTQARQTHPTDSTKIFSWMLETVADTNGNSIDYTYYKDMGQIYPELITYGIFTVDFGRSSRSKSHISHASNFAITTRYITTSIDININGVNASDYDITLSSDLISAIQASGTDGQTTVSLPSTTFKYDYETPYAYWNTTATSHGMGTVDKTQTDWVDVNGDGLVDVVYAKKNVARTTYINQGSNTFDNNAGTWTVPMVSTLYINDGSTYNPSFWWVDVNADGLVDIVAKDQANSVYLNNGTGWNTTSVSHGMGTISKQNSDWVDVNGDGLPDLVYAKKTSASQYSTYINQGNNTFDNSAATWKLPLSNTLWIGDGSIYNPSFWWTDINGDGLIDIVPKDVSNTAYLNIGNGWATSTPVNHGLGTISKQNSDWVDVNGDGLPDLVYAKKTAPTVYSTDINQGDNSFSHASGDWTLPLSSVLWIGDGSTYNPSFWWADVDGDGLADVVAKDQSNSVYLNKAAVGSNLIEIKESTGSIATINYVTAQELEVSNDMPFIAQVVSKITTNDKNGNIVDTTYGYKNADYYYKSALDRKFAGFGEVTKVNPDGSKVVTKYHQANGQTGNEPTDTYAKIGKPYEDIITNSSGSTWLRTRFAYTDASVGVGATSSLLTSELTQRYDGTSNHTDTAVNYEYDSYGNVLTETLYGVVTGSADGTFTDTGSDKRTVESTYTTNTTDYIVGLPKSKVVKNNAGTQEARTNYHYDSDSNLLQEGGWIIGADFATTTYTYNSYGLVTSVTDPLGNPTAYTYDTYNLYPATTTNALSQATSQTYDYSSGKPKITTDPNGKVTEYIYDGLDRLVTEKQTIGNAAREIVRTRAYNTSANPQYITDTIYRSGTDTHETRTYLDGFGREIQKKSQYSSGWATLDTVYDSMGRVKKLALPYSKNSNSKSSATTNSNLLTVYTFDPLGRVLTSTDARGVTTMVYGGLTTSVTDAESNGKEYMDDAYGNLAQVKEYNGTSTFTTIYGYNTQDLLTNITDALSNVRAITYDGLGRRIQLQDLHASGDSTYGVWNFVYDDVNLLTTTDPNTDVTTYTYDDLNRILTENSDTTGYIDMIYTYDACTNGVGNICTVADNAATTTYTYYKQGAVQNKTVTIDGIVYSTNASYNRQNQPTSIVYPNNDTVTYAYTVNGLPATLALNGVGYATSTYGVHGKPIKTTYRNGYVLDNIYDATDLYVLSSKTTGIATTSTPFIEYSTTTIPAFTTSVLTDNFESSLTQKWVESNEYDWQTEPEAIANVPNSPSNNDVLHADECTNYCIVTNLNSLNLSTSTSAQLTLWRFVGSALDSGEYLKVQVYNGVDWIQLANWTSGAGNDNAWHYETYSLNSYMNSNFKVRFLAKMNSNGEHVEVDDVAISASFPQQTIVSTSTGATNNYTLKIQNLEYSYDNAGNIVEIEDSSVTDTKKTQSFTYDDLYRLTGVTTSNVASGTSAYTQSFVYSPTGNITNFNGNTLAYAGTGYANPHAATADGGETQTYDTNGNLTNDGTWTHSFDYRNRLTSSTDGSNTVTYQYNHENARTKLTEAGETTYYPFSDYEITSGTPKLYLSLGDTSIATIEGATTTYLHTDHLGGTTLTTNPSGSITQTLDYYPYGDARLDQGSNDEDTQYIGEKHEILTDLNYLNARYYNANTGRFISQDPVFLGLGNEKNIYEKTKLSQVDLLKNPQALNSYSYAVNNPIRYSDPSGLWYFEGNYGMNAWGISANVGFKLDPVNDNLFVSYGAGKSIGSGAFLTATYVNEDLPDTDVFVSQDVTVSGAYSGIAGSVSGSNQMNEPKWKGFDLSKGVSVGFGAGKGVAVSGTVNQNVRIVNNHQLTSIRDSLSRIVSQLTKLTEKKSKDENKK